MNHLEAEILYRKQGDALETPELNLDPDDLCGFRAWEFVSCTAQPQMRMLSITPEALRGGRLAIEDFFAAKIAAKINELRGQGFDLCKPTPPREAE